MAEPSWQVIEKKTEPHWLVIHDTDAGLSAQIKRNGCIHLRRYYNGATVGGVGDADTDYLHICDLDEMIASLQALKVKALEHFGEDWPGWQAYQ